MQCAAMNVGIISIRFSMKKQLLWDVNRNVFNAFVGK